MKNGILAIALATLATFTVTGESLYSPGIISPENAKKLLAEKNGAVLLDVRTADEYSGGHIPKAILLPYDAITRESAAKAIPLKESTVVVYCRSGRRSAIAVRTLNELGYANVYDLGGIIGWPYEIVK
jgi:rhodanese-related sulfurtransferase